MTRTGGAINNEGRFSRCHDVLAIYAAGQEA